MGFWNEHIIEEYGIEVIGVFGTIEKPGPNFTYSIGMMDHGWPEIIAVGLPNITAHTFINQLFALTKACGIPPNIGEFDTELANLPMKFGAVSENNIREYLCQAYYRSEEKQIKMRAIQLIWCDREGIFPDETGFDESMRKLAVLLA